MIEKRLGKRAMVLDSSACLQEPAMIRWCLFKGLPRNSQDSQKHRMPVRMLEAFAAAHSARGREV